MENNCPNTEKVQVLENELSQIRTDLNQIIKDLKSIQSNVEALTNLAKVLLFEEFGIPKPETDK